MNIRIPNGWKPRAYQLPLWRYMYGGGKRAIAIWHRRAGKDDVALHWAMVAAIKRPATYWHMLPEYAQGRKAIWNAVNPLTGKRRIDEAFPKALRKRTNEQEMFIEFVSGATWQVIGSDRYDSTVGSPPAGIVFSEWALANPAAWGYLSPILIQNGGWAVFITTPRGNNHAKRILDLGLERKDWFAQVLTVDETAKLSAQAGETAPMSVVAVEEQRAEYRGIYGEDEGDALIEQEYYCSFAAAVLGSYYGKLMVEAERDGRICPLEPEEHGKVHTAIDIGVGDATAIWWFQIVGSKILILDYYEAQGYGAEHYVAELKSKPYRYAKDQHGIQVWVPHDAKVREWGTGKSRIETLIEYGVSPQLVPDHTLEDGINAVRQILPKCVFRKGKTDKGADTLREYRKDWDEEHLTFRDRPLHNWASHGSDAFRYLAMACRHLEPAAPKPPRKLLTVGPGNEATLDDLWPAKRQQSTRI